MPNSDPRTDFSIRTSHPWKILIILIVQWWQGISVLHNIWTTSSEFGTYRLCEQRRFRQACASAQSRQNLRCSLIQIVNQEEPSDRKPDPWPLWMTGHAQLKFVMTECSKTQIRLTALILFQDSWKMDAFSAHKMENGNIYARGTQVNSYCHHYYTTVISHTCSSVKWRHLCQRHSGKQLLSSLLHYSHFTYM